MRCFYKKQIVEVIYQKKTTEIQYDVIGYWYFNRLEMASILPVLPRLDCRFLINIISDFLN